MYEAAVISELLNIAPKTKSHLHKYVESFFKISIPNKKICHNHCAPIDYLWHSFTADNPENTSPNGDCVVWANRGGGKTQLAAVATVLDCIFKPSCQVRILGGSFEQSKRVYEYIERFTLHAFSDRLSGEIRKRHCGFKNLSNIEILTQSSRNVRGRHVHKLRCDEAELFDPRVFSAAKFITRGESDIRAAMEVISTLHKPYGLMHNVVGDALNRGTPVFQWCLWEVIRRCVDRTCSQCPLWSDCGGKAKKSDGYLTIDDAITQMRRSSRAAWESEMLCLRPSLENSVFADFDEAVHIKPLAYNANLPLYRAIDFGFVNPFVCLWIQVDRDGIVRVIDEYVRSRATIDVHAAQIKKRTLCSEENVTATFCDPAGAGVNDVNGSSAVKELRSFGIICRYRKSAILEGVELIRRALRDGQGKSSLVISPACQRLIEAMRCYHYPEDGTAELPLKDGIYDHPIDALRYFFVNFNTNTKVKTIWY